jgi:hypothetical protein
MIMMMEDAALNAFESYLDASKQRRRTSAVASGLLAEDLVSTPSGHLRYAK